MAGRSGGVDCGALAGNLSAALSVLTGLYPRAGAGVFLRACAGLSRMVVAGWGNGGGPEWRPRSRSHGRHERNIRHHGDFLAGRSCGVPWGSSSATSVSSGVLGWRGFSCGRVPGLWRLRGIFFDLFSLHHGSRPREAAGLLLGFAGASQIPRAAVVERGGSGSAGHCGGMGRMEIGKRLGAGAGCLHSRAIFRPVSHFLQDAMAGCRALDSNLPPGWMGRCVLAWAIAPDAFRHRVRPVFFGGFSDSPGARGGFSFSKRCQKPDGVFAHIEGCDPPRREAARPSGEVTDFP